MSTAVICRPTIEGSIRVRALCPDPNHRKLVNATVEEQGWYGLVIKFDCGARYAEGQFWYHRGPRGGQKKGWLPRCVWDEWPMQQWIRRLATAGAYDWIREGK